MRWDPIGAAWQQWNGGTCTGVAAAPDGGTYSTNDCRTVYRSGGMEGRGRAAAGAVEGRRAS